MSLQKWVDGGIDLEKEDFARCWDDYRRITSDGISKYTDDVIRDLHARMSMLFAYNKYQQGLLESVLSSRELELDLLCAKLLNTVYNEHTTVKRNEYEMQGDDRYIAKKNETEKYNVELIIKKALVNALESAVQLLSREISYRIKN